MYMQNAPQKHDSERLSQYVYMHIGLSYDGRFFRKTCSNKRLPRLHQDLQIAWAVTMLLSASDATSSEHARWLLVVLIDRRSL